MRLCGESETFFFSWNPEGNLSEKNAKTSSG